MNKLVLTPRGFSSIPLEADVISPDVFAGKTVKEIRGLKIHYGNREVEMSEYIHVQGKVAETPEEQSIVIDGDARHIKYIGKGMTAGRIVVQGDAGMHTGSQMAGGDLTVTGNVGDWAGAEMKGGLIRVLGDAGNLLGAAYRGSSEGMTGGCIIVKGDVGSEAASFMRRGMLIVEGDTGPFTGVHMNGGEVLIFGRLGKRAGAQAKGNGGFIASFGGAEEILPTYVYEATYTPNFMRLYLMQLAGNLGIERASGFIGAPLKRYRGDMAVGGTSEILVAEKVDA
jgi:formylmethanofuran dehydrogenase subunit C